MMTYLIASIFFYVQENFVDFERVYEIFSVDHKIVSLVFSIIFI